METQIESIFIEHTSCSACGSSDANAVYSDHSFCFACETHVNLEDPPVVSTIDMRPTAVPITNFIKGDYQALRKRGISEQTCRALGYSVGEYQGKPCHIAPITDSKGRLVAQKLRLPGKDFRVLGDLKAGGLIFQNKCKTSGKRLVITEGEIDALSYATVAPDWPVVSLPNGCSGGVKAVKKSLEFCEGFDEVVLLLDSDEPGRAAALEIAALLSPGKCKIAELPLKDANEMLVAGRVSDLKHAVYNAKLFSPEGIVQGMSSRSLSCRLSHPKATPFHSLSSTQ